MSAKENHSQRSGIEPAHRKKEMLIKKVDRSDAFDVLIALGVDNLTEEERASLRRMLEKTTIDVGISRTKSSWHLIVFMFIVNTIVIFAWGLFMGRLIWF